VIASLNLSPSRNDGVCLMSTFVKPSDRSICRIASIGGSEENSYCRPLRCRRRGTKLRADIFSWNAGTARAFRRSCPRRPSRAEFDPSPGFAHAGDRRREEQHQIERSEAQESMSSPLIADADPLTRHLVRQQGTVLPYGPTSTFRWRDALRAAPLALEEKTGPSHTLRVGLSCCR